MKKSLLSVALMAMLGSSSLMADIDDYVANDDSKAENFVRQVIKMAEKGDMDIIDFYSNQVLPSEAGLPLTQEELKNRIVKDMDNDLVFKGRDVTRFILSPMIKNEDNATIQAHIGCAGIKANGELDGIKWNESNSPMIISVENGKYRIKSMPAQTQEGCYRFDF